MDRIFDFNDPVPSERRPAEALDRVPLYENAAGMATRFPARPLTIRRTVRTSLRRFCGWTAAS